jgi:phi13 family phage major tail protein
LTEGGQLDSKASDVAPYVGVAFEFLLGNGKKRCVKLWKGKFTEPADGAQTRGENVEFQTSEATAAFVQLKNNGMYKSTKDFDADASTDSWYASMLPA